MALADVVGIARVAAMECCVIGKRSSSARRSEAPGCDIDTAINLQREKPVSMLKCGVSSLTGIRVAAELDSIRVDATHVVLSRLIDKNLYGSLSLRG